MTDQEKAALWTLASLAADVLMRMSWFAGSEYVGVMDEAKKYGIVKKDWTDNFF
jgi:hypothetical protein